MIPSVIPTGPGAPPLRRSARRLRWFKETFSRQTALLSEQTGVTFEIDDKVLRRAFLSWLTAFEAQLPTQEQEKPDYVNFAAGLMLRELIRAEPAKVTVMPPDADESKPAHFWPEGFLYVALCLNIRAAVLEQDFDFENDLLPGMDDLHSWWSFKENMSEDINLAIGFFDHFADVEPSWLIPSLFQERVTNKFSETHIQSCSEAKLAAD